MKLGIPGPQFHCFPKGFKSNIDYANFTEHSLFDFSIRTHSIMEQTLVQGMQVSRSVACRCASVIIRSWPEPTSQFRGNDAGSMLYPENPSVGVLIDDTHDQTTEKRNL